MALRKLGDGTVLDTDTGNLYNYDVRKEAAGRKIAEQAGMRRPIPNRGQQIQNVSQITQAGKPSQTVIQPHSMPLAVNPFELGVGAMPVMSDTTKRIACVVGIVAVAAGIVYLNKKMDARKKSVNPARDGADDSDD